MRMSKFYMPTLKENPAEAEIASHKLLFKIGYDKKIRIGYLFLLAVGI